MCPLESIRMGLGSASVEVVLDILKDVNERIDDDGGLDEKR